MPTDVLVERSPNSTSAKRYRAKQQQQQQQQQVRDGHVGEFGSRGARLLDGDETLPSPSSRMYKSLPLRPQIGARDHDGFPPPTSSSVIHSPASNAGIGSNGDGQQSSVNIHPPMYGYTPTGWDKQLDVPAVAEVVLMCGEQIRMRGLTLPLIFSSMALDLSSHRVSSLIKAYLTKPRDFYVSETRFANPHDLAAVIKWALARLGRVFPVPIPSIKTRRNQDVQEETVLVHQRGFVEIEAYVAWSASEKQGGYPLPAFSAFLEDLSTSSAALLVALFSLLSSTTAYSLQNGMTASRLSRLFGILIFGAPEDETFDKTYDAYLRASNATEHLLLAYIRDMSTMEPLPTRLAEVVKGYPAMLATDLSRPGKGVRGLPFITIKRSVRLYSVDLVQQASSLELDQSKCEAWRACCAVQDRGTDGPYLSDRYRKLINLRSTRNATSSASTADNGAAATGNHPSHGDLESYSSLADKAWGTFMNEGFAMPDSNKLAFDLRESERKARTEDPKAVQWSQFEQSGFELSHDGLTSVLAFDDLLQEDVKRLPEYRAQIITKIRKTNKAIPPFTYDTTPIVVSSPSSASSSAGEMRTKPYTRIDEVFVEVFADVLLGNGWSNRDELTHRDANFVVVQYKRNGAPTQGRGSDSHLSTLAADPDDEAVFVVEEVVPAQYRSELEAYGRKKNRSRASIRNLTRMVRRKDNSHVSDNFLDEIFRRSGNGPIRMNLRDRSTSTLALVERSDTIRGQDANTILTTANTDQDGASSQSTSVKLLAMLKSRASRRLRKKASRFDSSVTDDVPPPPPPKGKTRLATRSSWDSIDFEARSLHESEGDAVTLGKTEDIAREVNRRNLQSSERKEDEAWLDITVRPNDHRLRNVHENGTNGSIPSPDKASKPAKVKDSPARRGDADSSLKEVDGALSASGWSREDDVASDVFGGPSGAKVDRVVPPTTPAPVSSVEPPSAEVKAEKSADSAPKSDDSKARAVGITPSDGIRETVKEGDVGSGQIPRHLRALPTVESSSLEERERAREARIAAAKERARQLRANLNPGAMEELKKKQGRQSLNTSSDDSNSVTSSVREAPLLTTPTKPSASGTRSPPISPVSQPDTETGRDNPFAKDRFSGRVANITSKFGGTTVKASPPRSSSLPTSSQPSEQDNRASSTISSAAKVFSALSTQSGLNGGRAKPDNRSGSSPSPGAGWEADRGGVKGSSSVVTSNRSDPTSDPAAAANSTLPSYDLSLSQSERDTIYPEDAASNVSRDTAPPEDERSERRKDVQKDPVNATVKPAVPLPSLLADLGRSPASAGAAASSRANPLDPPPGAGAGDKIHEAWLASLPLEFRQRYQPGMPLSNVEEERESVLSGSNV